MIAFPKYKNVNGKRRLKGVEETVNVLMATSF